MSQGLRPSQYITTFGPGALIETPHGPHILCSTEEVLSKIQSAGIRIEDLAIRDIRLQAGLLEGDRIFKIPDESFGRFSHPTRKFPTWNLCVHHTDKNVIHRAHDGCPLCRGKAKEESKSNRFAIRFLVACPNGHLDDVDWHYLVHLDRNAAGASTPCPADHFLWVGSGSSLSSIRIECPVCRAHKSLGEIYKSRLRCRGRRPENIGGSAEACGSSEAIVVQRGSFQLRLPEVITSLTIPPLVTALHRLLQREDVQAAISAAKAFGLTQENLFRIFDAWLPEKRIDSQIVEELRRTNWGETKEAIDAIEKASAPRSRLEYLRQEHDALTNVIETGFPPYPPAGERRPGESVSFQVESTAIRREIMGPSGNMMFRVMPIERLRVVMVQVGYRRVEYSSPQSHLSRSHGRHPMIANQFWVPGVEQFGEGIYLDLNPGYAAQGNWYPQGDSAVQWDREIPPSEGPSDLIAWNALSVWWHSLAHRLINALSLHSGYSSTAIRERIYLSENEKKEKRGGILLYTTQPGGDGTMGGLTSLIDQFEHILELAFCNIDRCSNDPLCEHAEIDHVSKLGAACYSCEMVSETSCEHFNSYLNRRILLDNLP